MISDSKLALLYGHAGAYRFEAFEALLAQALPELSPSEQMEAYGMRAQIKLRAFDETMLCDLQKSAQLAKAPQFPCLLHCWQPDSANCFVVMNIAKGAVKRFLRILPRAGEYLDDLYGEMGRGMARQQESEILYFQGAFEEALALAQIQCGASKAMPVSAMMAQYVMFRCNLALGAVGEAEQCMLQIVSNARTSPETHSVYGVIREWANLTTGWSGDTPRFRQEAGGRVRPVLQDRMEAIQGGISSLSPTEQPFADYARNAAETYTMRKFYMDVFDAIYWLQAGEGEQAEACFAAVYQIAVNTGIIAPFIEYGAQLLPLFQYVVEKAPSRYDEAWISRVRCGAEAYEESLQRYRS